MKSRMSLNPNTEAVTPKIARLRMSGFVSDSQNTYTTSRGMSIGILTRTS